jgi:predicted PurR-regulated permease PerM
MSETPGVMPAPVVVPPAETPTQTALLGLAIWVVAVASLYLAREVLLPITLAALLSFLLAPLVRVLRRLWLGRIGSVIVAVLAAVGIVVVLGGLIGTQVASLISDVPRYSVTIEAKLGTVETFATRSMARLIRSYHRESRPAPAGPRAPGAAPAPVSVQVQAPPPSALSVARQVLTPVLEPLATAGIIFTVAIFLLLQREDLRDRMIRLFGSGDLHRTTLAMNDAAVRLSRYFVTQFAINASFGGVIGVGLTIIGVPSPALWGVIAALMRFVPYVGTFISAALPTALAAAVSQGWGMTIETACLFFGVEFIVGQAVEPYLYGRNTGLSPFAVIIAAIFWSWIWGPIGLIISTPLTLCLVVIGRHVPRLEFLDVLLGDQPALSPVESFYQRMLAGDPDEAQAQAEQWLRERALSSYYDEVAIKALLLATQDAERGVLGPERLARISRAVDGLIEELVGYDDPKPGAPPAAIWGEGAPILCVAGRAVLDEVAARMLAQLLGKHGLGVRVVPNAAAGRGAIATLDLSGVRMVCVIGLGLSGTPSSLRYLVARLRRRLPSATLLVGLWLEDDASARDGRVCAELGVQHCVLSLREAVQACLETTLLWPEPAIQAA